MKMKAPAHPTMTERPPTETVDATEKTLVVSKPLHPAFAKNFAKGHAKMGGRGKPKPAPFDAVETARSMGFDAIALMISVIQNGTLVLKNGDERPVETNECLKMLREVAPFVVSKAPVQITGEVEHKHQHVDVTRIMADPRLAEAAERLALAISGQEQEEAIEDAEFTDVEEPR